MKDVLPPGILIVFLIMIIIMIRMMIGIDSSKIFCRSARSYLFVLRKSVRGSRLRLLLFIYRFVTADPETQKIPQPILPKGGERLWDFHYAAFIGTGDPSCVTHRCAGTVAGHTTRVRFFEIPIQLCPLL